MCVYLPRATDVRLFRRVFWLLAAGAAAGSVIFTSRVSRAVWARDRDSCVRVRRDTPKPKIRDASMLAHDGATCTLFPLSLNLMVDTHVYKSEAC